MHDVIMYIYTFIALDRLFRAIVIASVFVPLGILVWSAQEGELSKRAMKSLVICIFTCAIAIAGTIIMPTPEELAVIAVSKAEEQHVDIHNNKNLMELLELRKSKDRK